MKDTYKALLIGLGSRILVVAVVVLASVLIASNGNLAADHSRVPIISLFDRWDSGYYVSIAKNGYPAGYPSHNFWTDKHFNAYMPNPPLAMPQWAFFPLYPAAMRVVSQLFFPFRSAVNGLDVAGFIVSNVAFFFAIYFFYKLTNKIFESPQIALLATAFFSFWGGALFYSAVYSESLFMALTLAAFYYLEADEVPIAALFGFLAAFTRSDGFLIFIPFLVYGLQSMKNKPKMLQLLACSAFVASPFLNFQLIGYEVAGRVFPITLLARNLNWQVYPVLWKQLATINPGYSLFYSVGLLLILMPAIYLTVHKLSGSNGDDPKTEADLLKYWFFYAATLLVILFDSNVYSTIRYAVPMLPIYWVSAVVYKKNRYAGGAILWVTTGMLIIGCVLFETRGYFM
jgi:hypothetical protein